jgi:hypothetical protein
MIAAAQPENFSLPTGTICRFILGRDERPAVMPEEEIAKNLNDSFATLLLRSRILPLTARSLVTQLDKFDVRPDGLPLKKSFLVADGGQIRWSPETANLNRQFRIVILRGREGKAELLVSTSTVFDSESLFLQVFSWDPVSRAFNFYERRTGAWCWAGSSWDALADDSRGNGPFDSHVNGAPVMKELKLPWMHWHSQAAAIPDEALEPGDALRSEPLFREKSGAEELEVFVRSGIRRWVKSRFDHAVSDKVLKDTPSFFRQVLTTTTVNLATSPDESRALKPEEQLRLPRTFFLNTEALMTLLNLPIRFPLPQTAVSNYFDCLRKYDVQIRDRQFSFPGDTHFAFAVPEPAFEDVVILEELLSREIISSKCAAALCLVDFSNPVFSEKRARLLHYVPDTIPAEKLGFDAVFVPAVRAAAQQLSEDAPENEFFNWLDLSDADWENAARSRVQGYLDAVQQRLGTSEGFDSFFRLGESRRREFRRRPLAEFRLTTPTLSIPEDSPALEMTPDATVQTKT